MNNRISIALMSALALVACGTETEGEEEEPQFVEIATSVVASGTDQGLTIELRAIDGLKTGRTRVFYRLTDDATGDVVKDATLAQVPWMTMMAMEHSSPVIPVAAPVGESELYEGAVVFTMPSGDMGTWKLTTTATRDGVDHVVVFDALTVTVGGGKKELHVGEGDDLEIHFVTFSFDEEPAVGLNDVVVTIHKKASMMSFPGMTDLTVAMLPQMPSMGHGSDGNIDPVHVAAGVYEGKVNFSMTGVWTVDLTFARGSDSLGTVQFELEL